MRGLLLPLLFCPTYLCFEFFSIFVPRSVSLGDPVWLYVDYDTEGNNLYSVKWYKDDMLFYNYTPTSEYNRRLRKYTPTVKKEMYSVDGVFLNMDLSNETHVFLYKSDLATEGKYRCDVRCGFRTIMPRRKMNVHVIPSEAPQINGVSNYYTIGDLVNITCVFGPAKPFAKIIWYINGEEVPGLHVYPTTRDLPLKIVMPPLRTESLLSFILGPGVHSVTCAAVMADIYSSVHLELLYSAKGFKRILHALPGQKGPLITGELERYTVGDEVDLNCSAAESTNRSKLEWYINYNGVPPQFLSGDGVSSLGLRFPVTADHFGERGMSLVCTANPPADFVIKTSAPIPVYSSIASVTSPSLLWLVLLMFFS